MCGITAIFSYSPSSPPVDQAELLRIREAMVKRGPDGAGLWISSDQRIGIAHRRLAIIDLGEAAAQPMATPDGTVRIVFNGEIYNYRELRKLLESKGYTFRSQSDTEVLLHLYQEHDRDMVHHLRGMYAFVIWDERKRGVFLARDPFGIKPLYYADDGATFRIASQVKALLKGGKIDTAPEPAGHVGFYLWGHVPEPYTLYRGIRTLPAGAILWIDATGHKETRQVFNLTAELAKASEAPLSMTHEEMHERLQTALLDSVRHHLVADVPVGVFLSAGVDSTTLTALAKEVGISDLRTITLGFKEFQRTPHDEVPLAEMVAQLYGTLHQTRWVTKEDFQKERVQILDAMDQPSIDGVNTYFVSKAAAEAGLKVALSGLGGDELFGGYPSFQQIPRIVKTCAPFQSIPLLGKGFCYLAAPILKHVTSPKYAGLLQYGGTIGGAYLLRRGMFMPWELPDLLDGDMVREGWEELQPLSWLEATTQGINNTHLKVTALETTWYMRNQLLRDADWASMAHSLEIRVPMLDWPLTQSLVPLFASHNSPRKTELARTSSKPLPENIISRGKTGFAAPVSDWILEMTSSRGRGLRGWAKVVYQNHSNAKTARTVAVFRIGQLGDTVVALPAISAIRATYPASKMFLITDKHPDRDFVSSWEVLGPTGMFSEVIFYEVRRGIAGRILEFLALAWKIRQHRPDVLFCLSDVGRNRQQTQRDDLFFRKLCGIENLYGTEVTDANSKTNGQFGRIPSEVERLLAIVKSARLQVPRDENQFHLPIPGSARVRVDQLMQAKRLQHKEALIIAIVPGSKMPAKRWPEERFIEVAELLAGHMPNVHFMVLGSRDEYALSSRVASAVGSRASNWAGELTVIEAAEALSRCALYVGNDTGLMHLAAAVGTLCVALFSARDVPGRWDPYGKGHIILRKYVPCEGCMVVECREHDLACLREITAEEVFNACRLLLKSKPDANDRARSAI